MGVLGVPCQTWKPWQVYTLLLTFPQMKTLSENKVKQNVEALGYQYIGPYINSKAPLSVICRCGCGEKLSTPYVGLLRGYGCARVTKERKAAGARLSIEEVRQRISTLGFSLVSGEYINETSPLVVGCPCGNTFESCLARIHLRQGCKKCSKFPPRVIKKPTIESIRKVFEEHGCVLLDTEYKDSKQKLSFQCGCGEISSRTLLDMKRSKTGCRKCRDKKISKTKLEQYALQPKQTPEERKEKTNTRRKNYYDTNTQFKLSVILRQRLQGALKRVSVTKSCSAILLIGCSINELRFHIESLWRPGMNWKNHTQDGWHIDHIIPCAAFDLTKPEEQRKCFHWSNLQPLWAKDNLSKSSYLSNGKRVRFSKILDTPPPIELG